MPQMPFEEFESPTFGNPVKKWCIGVALGATAHFHCFWRRSEGLVRFSHVARNLSAALFAGCALYAYDRYLIP